ncbi:hypothetical protein [Nonomuraea longicatena]|uniref:Uncharacterized protein n=1 Tax=Nonomuraea longicatena TaxID=83682 RepID=A0ABP4AGC0_9ACTN
MDHELLAALRYDDADITAYATVLLRTLGDMLPPDCVTVERDSGLRARLRGRDGRVRRLAVRLEDRVLTLSAAGAGRPEAEILHEVHGVTLSRQRVPVDAWVRALAEALLRRAEADSAAAVALRRLLADG